MSVYLPINQKFHHFFSRYLGYLPPILFLISIFAFSVILPYHCCKKSMIVQSVASEIPATVPKKTYEVFGFAPYWMMPNKLDTVDFSVLTTLAYFGVPVLSNGTLDKQDQGYRMFQSEAATALFEKAHKHDTRVVLTLTQMENATIKKFLDDPDAQQTAIAQAIWEVSKRGLDGVNIDFEYVGNPGREYREQFSEFVHDMTAALHMGIPGSRVTVSVYAASARDPKMYDVGAIARNSDGVFMMAYDFATTSSSYAMPTAPLYGHKEGKYWYDISTAVEDFLLVMPAEKLILGLPWYGYNYAVKSPEVKAQTNDGYYTRVKVGRRFVNRFIPLRNVAQPYAVAQKNVHADMNGITDFQTGWDSEAGVGWRAYFSADDNSWRILFLDDVGSLGMKYDFAKEKQLGGVGMWALGFDDGKRELWDVLIEKFGTKLANTVLSQKEADENI